MACRRCPGAEQKGSGYCKPRDTELAKDQEKAFKEMMAARQAQEAKWQQAWTPDRVDKPIETTPHVDDNSGFYFEGHYYRYPDTERIASIQKDVEVYMAKRSLDDVLVTEFWTQAPDPFVAITHSSAIAHLSTTVHSSAIAHLSTTSVVHPVEPKPPAPREVIANAVGSSSTTITSDQGRKSPAATCASR